MWFLHLLLIPRQNSHLKWSFWNIFIFLQIRASWAITLTATSSFLSRKKKLLNLENSFGYSFQLVPLPIAGPPLHSWMWLVNYDLVPLAFGSASFHTALQLPSGKLQLLSGELGLLRGRQKSLTNILQAALISFRLQALIKLWPIVSIIKNSNTRLPFIHINQFWRTAVFRGECPGIILHFFTLS